MFTPSNTAQAQTINFVTTKVWSDVSVTSMSGDSYSPAGPINLSKAASFTIPAGALQFVNPNRPGEDVTVTLYTASGDNIATCTTNNNRRNNGAITIDLSNFSEENQTVYFGYRTGSWWSGYTYYYTTTYTLTLLANATNTNTGRLNVGGFVED